MSRETLPESGRSLAPHKNDAKMQRMRRMVLNAARDPVTQQVVCWICGHGDGNVDGVDHVIPLSECATRNPPISPWAFSNLRAAHSARPCRTCADAAAELGNTEPGNRAGHCNSLRGSQSLRYARAKIASRTGMRIVDVDPGSDGRMPAETGEREW